MRSELLFDRPVTSEDFRAMGSQLNSNARELTQHLAAISRELQAIRTVIEHDKSEREIARPLILMAIGTATFVFAILYRFGG